MQDKFLKICKEQINKTKNRLRKEYEERLNTSQDLDNYWACMDGCYEMLEVIYEDVNETHKPLHSQCSDACSNLYLEENKTVRMREMVDGADNNPETTR